jgi:predicted ATPase
MSIRLTRMTLRGYKTIRELVDFEPGNLMVMIGANGAGKSNFISFFRLLSWALSGDLQVHVQETGPASALVHDGPSKTHDIEANLMIQTESGDNQYAFRLAYAAGDTLIYTDERFRFSRTGYPLRDWIELGAGHRESKLIERSAETDNIAKSAKVILALMKKIVVHQFHNTSNSSRIRSQWDKADGRWLKEDAANLAPFLYRLRTSETRYYQRIVETTRLILPFFADYELEPEHGRLLLSWREKGSDRVFNASQAADGMLRAMALVALLQQPEKDLPDVLILDEPELGLHPYAINVIAGLIQSVSTQVQVIVATQSVSLLDRFEPENIVVVDRKGRESQFKHLSRPELQDWLESYTLSELWEKNVIGGRPE